MTEKKVKSKLSVLALIAVILVFALALSLGKVAVNDTKSYSGQR